MSLCFRQERLLWRTEDALRRSDPHLAAMLAIFGKLAAAEPMPATEHVRTRLGRLRRLLARAAALAGLLAARAGHLAVVMLMQSATAWAAASGSFCQEPPWPGTSEVPGYGARYRGGPGGATDRAEREAGAG
jgi:hypothetical protein